jgi:hypothetical protein
MGFTYYFFSIKPLLGEGLRLAVAELLEVSAKTLINYQGNVPAPYLFLPSPPCSAVLSG